MVILEFEREIIQLLPPPYETNCQDYRLNGYQCREHCIAACKVERYLQIDGWPGDIYAESNVSNHFSQIWLNSHSKFGHLEEGLNVRTLNSCSDKCVRQDDCERIQYDVRTVRIKERDYDDPDINKLFQIGILPPKEVQMVIKHVPKFAPIEFLIYVGGLANLYLGFSAISFGVGILTYLSFSTKFQTKHCCVHIRKRRAKNRNRSNNCTKDKNSNLIFDTRI